MTSGITTVAYQKGNRLSDMPGIKKNLFYSILLILASYVFPFLTYPYVSRVLGVSNIGACNFVDSVINYFILFSMLGLDSLGVREIAKHKGDRESLNRTFSNLLAVNMMLTVSMLCLLAVLTFTVPQLAAHKDLMFFGAFKLLFNSLLVEWLYKGLEDFKLITLRSIIVKSLYVVSVFIFVRNREDVWVYYMLSCMMVVVNALVNMVLSRFRVTLTFKGLNLALTFKSMLSLGLYAILTSMYTTFNITFLGFAAGETQVGFYGTATKLYGIIMALFTAFTSVMIPRMSNLVASGDMEKFRSYFGIAVEVLLGFSLPLIAWMMIMAPDIVLLISGPEFGGAVIPMTIIAPLLFVVGYEQILVLQTLMPLGKDKILLRNSLIGAATGVLLNLLVVPALMATGSAIVWIVSELLILVLSQVAVSRSLSIEFPLRTMLQNIAGYLPLAALVFLCTKLGAGLVPRLLVSVCVVSVYVYLYQLLVRKRNLFEILLRR